MILEDPTRLFLRWMGVTIQFVQGVWRKFIFKIFYVLFASDLFKITDKLKMNFRILHVIGVDNENLISLVEQEFVNTFFALTVLGN